MDLNEFVACGNDEIEAHADSIADLQETYDEGLITAEEYKELLDDIVRTVTIQTKTAEVELKANFLRAVSLISKAL